MSELKNKNIDMVSVEIPGDGESPESAALKAESDAGPGDVASFHVRILKVLDGEVEDERLRGTRPVYTDDDHLVGFFVMKSGGFAKLFLARDAKPFGLHLSSGIDFYFTIQVTTDGKHPNGRISGIISEVPIAPLSVKVKV